MSIINLMEYLKIRRTIDKVRKELRKGLKMSEVSDKLNTPFKQIIEYTTEILGEIYLNL